MADRLVGYSISKHRRTCTKCGRETFTESNHDHDSDCVACGGPVVAEWVQLHFEIEEEEEDETRLPVN